MNGIFFSDNLSNEICTSHFQNER